MNNLWNRIQQATKGKKYLHVPLDQQEAMQSDRSYLRIFIAEMFLESTFAWFKTWFPAVMGRRAAQVRRPAGDHRRARGAAARERNLKIAMFRALLIAVAESADNRQGKGAIRAVSTA